MAAPRYLRYVVVAVFCVIFIYYINTTAVPEMVRSKLPSVARPHSPSEKVDSTPQVILPTTPNEVTLPPPLAPGERANATFVSLARNSDVWEIARSIRQVEDRFNRKFNYDWVFLNDEDFSDEFKRITGSLVSGKAKYGKIPTEHWSFPSWIDQEKAAKTREDMAEKKIIYGDSISYRHMCRYESGFFFRHPLMLDYEWYWRVEPSIELYCDLDYDPFKFMIANKKKYSFTIALYEYGETITTLWSSTKEFMKKHKSYVSKGNTMRFLSDNGGKDYNNCHYWSNFEIASLDWLRSKTYMDYFEFLDQKGGFFYERWGDAPVHSLAASIFLKKEEIHFFNDIAYYHVPFTHCPTGEQYKLDHKCHCKPQDNFDWKGYSCLSRWYEANNIAKPAGYENEQDGQQHRIKGFWWYFRRTLLISGLSCLGLVLVVIIGTKAFPKQTSRYRIERWKH